MRLTNTIHSGQFRLFVHPIGVHLSDLCYLLIGEFCRVVSHTLNGVCATFRTSVSHIIGVSAKPQMEWVNTARVITGVKYLQTFGYSAVMKFPREMRAKHEFAIDANLTVTGSVNFGGPIPALEHAVNFYIIPESKYGIAFSGHVTPRLVLACHVVCGQDGDETVFSGATLDHQLNYSTEVA